MTAKPPTKTELLLAKHGMSLALAVEWAVHEPASAGAAVRKHAPRARGDDHRRLRDAVQYQLKKREKHTKNVKSRANVIALVATRTPTHKRAVKKQAKVEAETGVIDGPRLSDMTEIEYLRYCENILGAALGRIDGWGLDGAKAIPAFLKEIDRVRAKIVDLEGDKLKKTTHHDLLKELRAKIGMAG